MAANSLTFTAMGAHMTASTNVLTGFAEIVRAHGADPASLLQEAGIPALALGDSQARVPVASVVCLLELTATAIDCPDLGLRLSQARRLSHFGPLGRLARDEPDVRHALQAFSAWMYLQSDVILDLQEGEGTTLLSAYHKDAAAAASTQVIDLVMGGIMQLVRHLRGPQWHPQAVCLAHPAGRHPRAYRTYFGCPVEFAADRNALVISSEDLDAAIFEADPVFRSESEQQVQALAALRGRPVHAKVRELIQVMLPTGRCNMANVCLRLGVPPRTLRRQLAASGVTFADELDRARAELARTMLDTPGKSMAEIAAQLGYSETSAFSRWHRRKFGSPPSARRRQA